MPTKRFKPVTYRVNPDILEGLDAIRERDGVPVSEQVRRALRSWLKSKGIKKADRPRGGTRKRP